MSGSLSRGMAAPPARPPSGPAATAREFQLNPVMNSVQLKAGAPTTMPSKSSGKRCASISPWPPPREQPTKYERLAPCP